MDLQQQPVGEKSQQELEQEQQQFLQRRQQHFHQQQQQLRYHDWLQQQQLWQQQIRQQQQQQQPETNPMDTSNLHHPFASQQQTNRYKDGSDTDKKNREDGNYSDSDKDRFHSQQQHLLRPAPHPPLRSSQTFHVHSSHPSRLHRHNRLKRHGRTRLSQCTKNVDFPLLFSRSSLPSSLPSHSNLASGLFLNTFPGMPTSFSRSTASISSHLRSLSRSRSSHSAAIPLLVPNPLSFDSSTPSSAKVSSLKR